MGAGCGHKVPVRSELSVLASVPGGVSLCRLAIIGDGALVGPVLRAATGPRRYSPAGVPSAPYI